MNKLKVAVVGVGSISKHHIESYLNNENVELYAFCDINENRLAMMKILTAIYRSAECGHEVEISM